MAVKQVLRTSQVSLIVTMEALFVALNCGSIYYFENYILSGFANKLSILMVIMVEALFIALNCGSFYYFFHVMLVIFYLPPKTVYTNPTSDFSAPLRNLPSAITTDQHSPRAVFCRATSEDIISDRKGKDFPTLLAPQSV